MRSKLRIRFYLLLMVTAFCLIPLQLFVHSQNPTSQPLVYYIPVEQTVERGLEAFMKRSIGAALEEGAEHIVLEIDTPGGAVDAAGNIARLLRETDIPITAYVTKDAISAGAYIALNADQIVMAPGALMGSAGVIDSAGNAAEEKMQSYWIAEMEESAKLNGRDPLYARAMADNSVDLPEYNAEEGRFLTLTSGDALDVGYADALASNRGELLEFLQIENAFEKDMEVSFAEQVARFVTHPVVIPILLSIGSLGLVLELYSPGFGVPGIMGLSALLLFFFGHLFAGFAGWESVILFAAGVILILIEIFVPGFGIFGILGIGSIIGSMILASYSTVNILVSLLIAVVITTIVSILIFKYFGYRGPMKKIVFTGATTTEEGYITNVTRKELVGQIGKSITPLRPSGMVLFGSDRLDVISEGGYIEQGKNVEVVYTSGSRIVVREIKEKLQREE
ncbi:NfeD family protein [Alkalihalobacterium alkalinitrilicum]|uniref:NfeD family protein n=1 Tax=Alkalihalobacterium alkalinitrilicum TaxID=427920 RepID=UPI001EE49A26|nr:nodulation protein NfeD [Alkalihalobacterium alkalinitrilicum]